MTKIRSGIGKNVVNIKIPQKEKIFISENVNICSTFAKEDIEVGNLNLDIKFHSVMKYETEKSKRNKRVLNMWQIQFEPGSNVPELLRTRTFLCHSDAIFDRRATSGFTQCKNCQYVGHTAKNGDGP